ncbi:MAG: hypothetical protein JNM84_27575 [Planctomycetes bacterium]|nr:hypothetical protein [Planctomycetota bacterium]
MAWQHEKARENLLAGIYALGNGALNAAANRLYYSLYHIAWFELENSGLRPWHFHRDATQSWRHETLRGNATLVARHLAKSTDRRLLVTWMRLIQALQSERIKADYFPSSASRAILERHLPLLQALVTRECA